MYNMPEVDTENAKTQLADNEEGLAILDIIVKKDGTVRASKPKVTDDPITGKAAYVWRMVCFLVSPKPAHHCMPCTADYDLPAYDENGKWRYELARKMGETLNLIEKVIVDSVNKDEWHGVHRWGRIL